MTPNEILLAQHGGLLRKGIELVAGCLLLVAGYYALLSRRTADDDARRTYRRTVLRTTAGFLMFAYAAAVVVPDSTAWPVEFGASIRSYFQRLDAVPRTVNGELTAFYTAITNKVGVVTTQSDPQNFGDDPVAYLLKPIRTIGLVAYTLFFSAASLGLHVPRRFVAAIRGSGESEE